MTLQWIAAFQIAFFSPPLIFFFLNRVSWFGDPSLEEIQTYFHTFVPVGESWQNLVWLGAAQEQALPLNKHNVLEPVYLRTHLHVAFGSSAAGTREDGVVSVPEASILTQLPRETRSHVSSELKAE